MTLKKKQFEKLREKVINQGSELASDQPVWTTTCLRIPKQMLKDIDEKLIHKFNISRNNWILNALQNALDNDDS